MLKLRSGKQNTALGDAWMLKAKGSKYEATPVIMHIYGELGNLPANVEAALWLMKYNPYDKAEEFLKRYVCYLATIRVQYSDDADSVRKALHQCLCNQPFNYGKVIDKTKSEVADYLIGLVADMTSDEIYDLGDIVDDHSGDFIARDLNELFIRVRMNGEYNAGAYNGVCYFRIGSTFKNWSDPIWWFVYDHSRVKTIVVERDAEADGKEGTSSRDVMIDNMSRDEFLAMDRLPFLGSTTPEGITKTCYEILSKGLYSDLETVRANASRVLQVYERLRLEDISRNYTSKTAPWAIV